MRAAATAAALGALLAGCAANTGGRLDAGVDDAGADAFTIECARDFDCADMILCTVDHCEDGRCVNTQTSISHCGACNVSCAAGTAARRASPSSFT